MVAAHVDRNCKYEAAVLPVKRREIGSASAQRYLAQLWRSMDLRHIGLPIPAGSKLRNLSCTFTC